MGYGRRIALHQKKGCCAAALHHVESVLKAFLNPLGTAGAACNAIERDLGEPQGGNSFDPLALRSGEGHMGQISVEITRPNGSLLSGNQHSYHLSEIRFFI